MISSRTLFESLDSFCVLCPHAQHSTINTELLACVLRCRLEITERIVLSKYSSESVYPLFSAAIIGAAVGLGCNGAALSSV